MSRVVRAWHALHRLPRRRRWPLKAGFFLLTLLLVLYPRVWLLPVTIARLADTESVIDPTEPRLAPLESQVRASLPDEPELAVVRRRVEQIVHRHIPYAFDWETWGVMSFLPTTAEVLDRRRADCEGRAVVAASLLRRLGYQAWLVADLKHMWVVARDPATATVQELMSPGEGAKSVVATPEGTRVAFDLGLLANLGRSLAFGVAVFPLPREIIIAAALALVAMQPRSSVRRRGVGVALLLASPILLRLSHDPTTGVATHPAWAWLGLLALVAGWLTLAVRAEACRSMPAPPGSPVADGGPPG